MTAKLSAIIAQHITTQTRIIIPEIGTLIRRKESGEIVFMEMLKKSDGTLVGLVVNTLDVSPSKANEIVNSYVTTIKQQLSTNKKFILDGVGVLLARADGGLDFSFNPFAQSIPEPARGVGIDILEEEEFEVPAVAKKPKPMAPKPQAPKPQEPMVQQAPKPQAPKPEAPKPAEVAEQSGTQVATKRADSRTEEEQSNPLGRLLHRRESDEQEATERKSSIKAHLPRKKMDGLTIVAFIALLLALISLIWGAIPSGENLDVDVTPDPIEATE